MSPVLPLLTFDVLPLRGFSCHNAERPPRVFPEARVGAPDSPRVGRMPARGCLLRSWVRGAAG